MISILLHAKENRILKKHKANREEALPNNIIASPQKITIAEIGHITDTRCDDKDNAKKNTGLFAMSLRRKSMN